MLHGSGINENIKSALFCGTICALLEGTFEGHGFSSPCLWDSGKITLAQRQMGSHEFFN
jgi:hypothetical protein